MKITGPSGPAAVQPGSARPGGPRTGFTLGGSAGSQGAAAVSSASGPAGVQGLSALMALQGVEEPLERRRRAIRRGGALLDRLDALKLSLLEGRADADALTQLSQAVREERPSTDDAGLSGLLDQIDLRASVELAKAELRRGAA